MPELEDKFSNSGSCGKANNRWGRGVCERREGKASAVELRRVREEREKTEGEAEVEIEEEEVEEEGLAVGLVLSLSAFFLLVVDSE
jgi:hypothetical protein